MLTTQILVVEDERIVAKDIQRSLSRWGYQVPTVVPSGEEAIERAEEDRPDLVLMDVRLKGNMDGIDASEYMRNRLNIPVVFLSAYADAETLNRARKVQPFGYLVKPFEERELRATIEMALNQFRMEALIKENEEWLASIMECIGDAVIVADAGSCVQFLNPAAETLTGWTTDVARWKPLGDVLLILDEKTGDVWDPTVDVLQTGELVPLKRDVMLIARDGQRVAVEGSVSPIHLHKGTLLGYVAVCQDITRRKRVESSEHSAERRTLLRQKMEALVRLADGVSRELDELVADIRGNGELALADLAIDDPVHATLTEIKRAAYHAQHVIRRLRMFSGQLKDKPACIDLNIYLSRMNKTLHRQLGEEIDLQFTLARDIAFIRVDPDQLKEVILNVADLARNAMTQGGTLTIETANVLLPKDRVEPEFEVAAGRYVVLVLTYSGKGIDSDAMQHIYEPYFSIRPDQTKTEFGFAATYGIVRQMGGLVEVVSDPSGETTFWIYLPVADDNFCQERIVTSD